MTAPVKDPSPDPYSQLLEDIRTGALRPGDRVIETDLAARLGTSRTPVREAIRTLEADGLVVHTPRVGATIRALSYADITELYEMRAILEGSAARFAARASYDSETAEMAAITADMAQARGDAARQFALNTRFHTVLLFAARNQFLVRAVKSIQKTLLILGPSTLEDAARVDDAIAEHGAILSALTARDGDGAEAAMRHHIEAALRARLAHLRLGDAP